MQKQKKKRKANAFQDDDYELVANKFQYKKIRRTCKKKENNRRRINCSFFSLVCK